MEIRNAVPADAAAACEVLRRSISELCVADHGNDPAIIAGWIDQPGSSLLVAVENGTILAVGAVTDQGEITLNYVSPGARFRGISRALLAALEARAMERGNQRCTLVSTDTAHAFYRSAGYVDTGIPEGRFGTRASHPMTKTLQSPRPPDRSRCAVSSPFPRLAEVGWGGGGYAARLLSAAPSWARSQCLRARPPP
jgi:GNAT superfamily N-acetyltransferase